MENPVTPSHARLAAARVLAILGTVLVGIPLVVPIVFAVVSLASGASARLDYLMPGELYVVAPSGALVLVVAALVARRHRAPIGTLAVAAGVFFGITAALSWPGGAEGLRQALLVAAYALYVVALLALVVLGVVLCRATLSEGAREHPSVGAHRGPVGR